MADLGFCGHIAPLHSVESRPLAYGKLLSAYGKLLSIETSPPQEAAK
jgi:hypothetical protein